MLSRKTGTSYHCEQRLTMLAVGGSNGKSRLNVLITARVYMDIAKGRRFGKFVPVIALFLGLGGLWIGACCLYGIVCSNRASHCSTTDAKVVVSHLVAVHFSAQHPTSTTIQAEIRYQYHVGDNTFESDVVNYFNGQIGGTRHFYGVNMVNRYPVGQIVRVSYNSANPSDAVIDPRTPRGTMPQFVVGTVLFLGWVLYLIRINVLRRARE
jgi:hypothetical protein